MNRLLAILFLSTIVLNSCKKPTEAGDFPNQSVHVLGQKRDYRLYVPNSIDLTKANPVLFAFHGLKGTAAGMTRYSDLEELADREGFILLFPNSRDGEWGGGDGQMTKDVQFFDKMLKVIKKSYEVDENRIYVCGMSNGGFMSHKLGQKRSDVIAAICSHSGVLGLDVGITGINADRKFPVMIVHGDKDWLISVKKARKNRDRYLDEGHTVKYLELEGLGHVWGTDYSVNDSIWAFFQTVSLADK